MALLSVGVIKPHLPFPVSPPRHLHTLLAVPLLTGAVVLETSLPWRVDIKKNLLKEKKKHNIKCPVHVWL